MALKDNTYPQDTGTGLDETVDFNNAAEFAQLAHDINGVDYVVDGLSFTVDYTNNILNISEGVAKLYQSSAETPDHSADGGEGPKTIAHTVFVAQLDASGDLTLTDSATNHVFIGIDQNTQNRTIYQINTTDSPPAEPYLKLGTVDTVTDTHTEMNRAPAGTFRRLVIE